MYRSTSDIPGIIFSDLVDDLEYKLWQKCLISFWMSVKSVISESDSGAENFLIWVLDLVCFPNLESI